MRYTDQHRADYIAYYEKNAQRYAKVPHTDEIVRLMEKLKLRTLLDYGCGPAHALEISLRDEYCVRGYDIISPEPPFPAQMVVCHHVLEHVEPECLDTVLVEIKAMTEKATYLVVSLQESTKVLPSGEPWHKIVRPAEWWQEKFTEFFPGIAPIATVNDNEYAALWVK